MSLTGPASWVVPLRVKITFQPLHLKHYQASKFSQEFTQELDLKSHSTWVRCHDLPPPKSARKVLSQTLILQPLCVAQSAGQNGKWMSNPKPSRNLWSFIQWVLLCYRNRKKLGLYPTHAWKFSVHPCVLPVFLIPVTLTQIPDCHKIVYLYFPVPPFHFDQITLWCIDKKHQQELISNSATCDRTAVYWIACSKQPCFVAAPFYDDLGQALSTEQLNSCSVAFLHDLKENWHLICLK